MFHKIWIVLNCSIEAAGDYGREGGSEVERGNERRQRERRISKER